MKQRAKNIFAIIGALASLIAIVVGGIQLSDHFFGGPPSFEDEIALNDFRNEAFLNFLEQHDGKVVFIRSRVDMSPAMEVHIDTLNNCNSAYDDAPEEAALLDGYVFNRPIVLPVAENLTSTGICMNGITIEIQDENDTAELSYGGSGVITFNLHNFFLIESRAFSGPELRYTLKPTSAGIDDLLRQQ